MKVFDAPRRPVGLKFKDIDRWGCLLRFVSDRIAPVIGSPKCSPLTKVGTLLVLRAFSTDSDATKPRAWPTCFCRELEARWRTASWHAGMVRSAC
jgi:hypothetical protein